MPANDSHFAPPLPDSITLVASGTDGKAPSKTEKVRLFFNELRRNRKAPQISNEQYECYTGMVLRRLTAAAPDTSTPCKSKYLPLEV